MRVIIIVKEIIMANKYLQFVEEIQQNALLSQNDNCIDFELTYQQALSIYLRSRQLILESIVHPATISPDEKVKQINKCYRQRYSR